MCENYNSLSFGRDVSLKNGSAVSGYFSNGLLGILVLFCMLFTGLRTNAQNVTVSGAVSGNGSYATLGAAFTAIGTAQASANITISIVGDTNEGTATATLGAGTWAGITINPSGARTITGATTAGNPLIDFSGADNVTINGLNSGGNSLTISNTTAAANSGTSTMRFIGDATANTVTNCTILGSPSMAMTTNGGIIFFSTSTTVGNDNNTISNCNIGPAGSNLPSKSIYANGSTTSTARANSGITISGNNIYDYYLSGTHAAIYTNDGNTDWTISNNKFYQTASRTFSATTASVIFINGSTTANNNNLISGNTIGYASSTGTGTYTVVGVSGSVFIPINLAAAGTTTVTTVQNNTIAGINFSGPINGTTSSGAFRAIYMTGLSNANSNIIGSQSATGSIAISSSSASAGNFYGIYNNSSSNTTISSNQIGGVNVTNSSTATATFTGIFVNTSSSATTVSNSNIIGGTVANSINVSSSSTSSQVVGLNIGLSASTLTSNTVRNLVNNNGTGTGSGASVIGISITASGTNHTLSQNTIYNLANSNTTLATVVTGLFYNASSGANTVERSLIYGLTNPSSSATAQINGILVGGGTTTYKNNMIAIGAGTSASPVISGISEPALGTDNFWHNSVYIGGTATSGSSASYAFNSTQTAVTRSFRDNIFYNARTNSGGTGKHYIIAVGGTSANPAGLTINNNVYFGGTVFGFFNSADVASLAAWKTAVGQDVNSFSGNPQFLDPTNTTPDLHLSAVISTPAEGNGADVGVTDDFDGQTRSGLTPVDIGADAGAFTGNDLAGPTINYTPLGTGIVGTNQTLTATITDVSGVPTSGTGLPVLYYKVNSGSYTAVQGVSIGSNQYTFTFGSATTTGGDVVSYYIVAQDQAATPNVSVSPSGGATGFTINPPASSTPPTTPSTFTAQAALSGTKTVCASGCDYSSLTNAAGAFITINNSVLTGNLILQIAGDLTAETGTNALNAVAGSNTVKIYPTGIARVVSGSLSSAALIKLNGADRITIDGSIGGTGTDRSLTITNTNTTAPTAIALVSLGTGAGATDNTIKNCNISTGVATSIGYGISVGTTPGTSGADNDNTTLQNNNITVVPIGIFASGTASVTSGGDDNLSIVGNVVDYNSTLASIGIQVGNALNSSITQNTVSEQTSATQAPTAISLETGFVSSSVTRNKITKSVTTNSGGYGGRGITIGTGTATSALTIANNLIGGINGSDFSGFSNSSSMGIAIGMIGNSSTITTTAGGINLYNNSVSMTGNIGSNTSTAKTAALYVGTGASALDVRNNILANTMVGNSTTQKNYAIYSDAAASAFTTINYNDYYVSNTFNAASAVPGFLTSDRTNLAGIQSGFGQNANSTTGNPSFVSNTDLHISTSVATAVESAGTPIGAVTVDYDGDTRNATTPDIGADEGTFLTPVANDVSATAFIDPVAAGSKVVGVAFTPQASFTNNGTAGQTNVPVRYRIVGPSPATTVVYNQTTTIASLAASTTATASFAAATVAAAGTYTIYAKAELVGDTVGANDEISASLTITDPYTSSTTTQNSANVAVNTTNQQVIGIQVVASAATATLTSLTFNTNGTTAPATDITNAKIYYTGTTSTFSAIGQFGSTVAAPNGSHTVTGTQALASGTNYFWLTYDIPSGAVAGNVVDAEATSLIVNGITRTPSTTAPAGARTIVGPMSGPYLVGASQVFPNFTSLTAAIADLNLRGVSGATSFLIQSDYAATETFPLTINSVTGASGTNTITIKPATGVTKTISGTNATALLDLNAAKFVTVDGSNAGTATRDLTWSNTNTGGAVIRLINDATSNTVKNNLLRGVSTATSNGVVFLGTGTTTGNDNNTIQNNEISGGATASVYGFYNLGSTASTAIKNSGNTVSGNNIYNFSTTGIRDDGGSVGTVYSGNQIYEVATQTTAIAGFRPSATNIEGFTFNGNKIYDLKTTATSTVYGIHLFDTQSPSIGIITNNMIIVDATAPLTAYGIYDQTATGEVYNLYHNTVLVTGSVTGASNSIAYNWSIASTTNSRNNIFVNTRSGGTGKHYVIKANATIANLTSNYNDFYAGGGTGSVFGVVNTTDAANLAAWQTATSKDGNSVSIAPVFTSATDLHLTTANTTLDNLGTFIAAVATDYDGQTRSVTTPDMGADEFTACIPPTALSYTSNTVSYCANQAITTNSPSFTGSTATSYSVSPALPAGLNFNTTTGDITGTPTAATAAANYTVTVNNACGSTTKDVNITINIAPSALTYTLNTVAYCAGTAITTNAPSFSGSAATSYSVSPALPAGLNFNTTNGNITGTPTTATAAANYTVTVNNVCGATTKDVNITINAAPTALSYTNNTVSYCANQAITTNSPSFTGSAATSYSISPALPAGLNFNTTTGDITGTPTATAAAANYTVTVNNICGSTTKDVNIAVNIAPSNLTYTVNTVTYCKNAAITPNSPTFSGSTATSYSVSPALPTGLTLNTSTGVISGTPSVATAAANYTVTVNNACGSTTHDVNITIDGGSVYYADTDGDGFGAGAAIVSCSGQPANTVTNNTDCAPTDATKWRTGDFYVDADNDGYYNGDPSTVSVCYGATTPSGYTAAILGTDCDDALFEVNPNHVEVLGNGVDDNCDGTVDEVAPTSSLQPSQCGITLTNIAQAIYANQVAGAQGYRFEVTNGATVRTYDSAISSFNLMQLSGGATYATTYSIRVAVKTAPGFWRAYSSACSITTPAVPATTKISNAQCGVTLTSLSNTIYADQVTAATQYRFEVSGGPEPTRTLDTAVNRFSLTALAGGASYATTYSVRVALLIGGVWQDYGVSCNITTPATPGVTKVSAAQCGITISNSWTTIYADQVPEATGYRFEVVNGASTRFFDTPNARFNLHNLAGAAPAPNTVYTIRVAILFNSVYQPFGPACTITTAATITRQTPTPISVFEVKTYPNPFADTFKLNVNTTSEDQIEVKVYDMLGKLVEVRQGTVAAMMELEIGSRYSAGVYNLIVSQGDQTKSVRVIKR